MQEKTVEFQQMHDIDKIVRRCCAEIEEGLKTTEEDEAVATKTSEAHLVQYIDRVVDALVDKEPGDAEDAGSCCTKCHSDVEPFTDISPDGVAATAVQAQTTEILVESHEVKVPVAERSRVLRRCVREPRGAD